MAAIKKFFEKKKAEAKFKLAGPGHKLNEPMPAPQSSSKPSAPSKPNAGRPNESVKKAAEAALARFEKQSKPTIVKPKVLRQAIRKELEEEQLLYQSTPGPSEDITRLENAPAEPIGVFFTCPLVGHDLLPKKEMEAKIRSFLYLQLAEEPLFTSALMIHTFNKDKSKVNLCIETLCRYLDNIINSPGEEKYRKIRISNKVFQERVSCLEGSKEFMEAVGFEKQLLPHENLEDYFFVFPEENVDTEHLNMIREALITAEPILPELARNPQIFKPAQGLTNIQLSDDFFNRSTLEIKKEQKLKTENVDKMTQLRTKAMREKDEYREHLRYLYAQLRIRFPDGYILQGTFNAHATVAEVRSFVQENLANDWQPFILNCATGSALTDDESTIEELDLVPAAYINFTLDPSVQKDIAAQLGSHSNEYFLKPELIASVVSL